MAVDDASPQGGSYLGDNASTTNPPTSTTSPTFRPPNFAGLKIKPELLVRPDLFTLYFGFFGNTNWQRTAKERIVERLEGTWVMTGRNPRQEELDAFTVHTTRGMYYGRAGIPVSTFIGAAWMYQRGAKYFPTGANAKERLLLMRHIFLTQRQEFMSVVSRVAFRMFFIGTLGGIISGVASAYVNVGGLLSDPRLEQWRRDSKASKDEDIRKRKMQLASDSYHRARRSVEDKVHVGSSDYDSGVPEARVNDSSMSGFEPAQSQQQYGYGQSSGSPSTYESQPSQSSSSDFFGGSDDDASPTAPEYRNTNPDGSPMSSWDRIRQQNASSRPQPPMRQSPQAWGQSQNQPESAPIDTQDRYDFDKSREREQAQAEFDRMMEAERNASDEPTRRGWGS
ncbi:uncharacterized protein N7484_009655 [Penicillium longicatenatum]|uniref:uncharacterized protein n=1 Tax=Penicillium longicatenatum TaxID=1561947 RepID=UPI002548DBAF|nr:uncharacterized protein N7484_009655 [Penicillium longicatenatum]KAJ5636342.1 hypothetical protein N7484_009655 [Penicillium longicatenatum]